ncbi:hypothetical protein NDU88_013197 [Pleurodeles waltl]|uniref:Uncharacterized protein n=1 Tax=Pleurodeles waltl TaxID=8319 RepID=A0AAV7R896_PLEWA|nr:hypothetical protein NDU88_013197 [Pleurodeles waltl]
MVPVIPGAQCCFAFQIQERHWPDVVPLARLLRSERLFLCLHWAGMAAEECGGCFCVCTGLEWLLRSAEAVSVSELDLATLLRSAEAVSVSALGLARLLRSAEAVSVPALGLPRVAAEECGGCVCTRPGVASEECGGCFCVCTVLVWLLRSAEAVSVSAISLMWLLRSAEAASVSALGWCGCRGVRRLFLCLHWAGVAAEECGDCF